MTWTKHYIFCTHVVLERLRAVLSGLSHTALWCLMQGDKMNVEFCLNCWEVKKKIVGKLANKSKHVSVKHTAPGFEQKTNRIVYI